MEMQPSGRLIENEHGGAGIVHGEIICQLYALILTTGESGRTLAEFYISETDILQRTEPTDDTALNRAIVSRENSIASLTVMLSTSLIFLS